TCAAVRRARCAGLRPSCPWPAHRRPTGRKTRRRGGLPSAWSDSLRATPTLRECLPAKSGSRAPRPFAQRALAASASSRRLEEQDRRQRLAWPESGKTGGSIEAGISWLAFLGSGRRGGDGRAQLAESDFIHGDRRAVHEIVHVFTFEFLGAALAH